PPFLSFCEYCEETQFVMLGRAGGRRIFFRSSETTRLQKGLDAAFEMMSAEPGKLHYRLEKYLPGLEILFEHEDLMAKAVWKNGDDLRLLLENSAVREKADEEMRKIYRGDVDDEDEAASEAAVPAMSTATNTAVPKVLTEKISRMRQDIF